MRGEASGVKIDWRPDRGFGTPHSLPLTPLPNLLPIHPVVRRFLRDNHVMHVAFAEAGDRLPDERGLLLKSEIVLHPQ